MRSAAELRDNAPPVAAAGADLTVYGGNLVHLRGQGEDSDGQIASYRWEQESGIPVSLRDGGDGTASFVAPRDSRSQLVSLRLTITDDAGASAADQLSVRIQSPAAVEVSRISGHTGSPGARAYFVVRLGARPDSEVSLPIWSSDESQGAPEASSLHFTPENWRQWQGLQVRGTGSTGPGKKRDYWLRLGPVDSADPAYAGFDPEDLHLSGLDLALSAPEAATRPLLPGRTAILRPVAFYSGARPLSYLLSAAPDGAEIDFSSGEIRWVPSTADAGRSAHFKVRATDGALFSEISFEASVASPMPVSTERNFATGFLEIVDQKTNLNGLRAWLTGSSGAPGAAGKASSVRGGELGDPQILSPEAAPPVPDHIQRLSDILTFPEKQTEPLTLMIPIPSGTSSTGGIRLYVHGRATGVAEPFWIPIGLSSKIVTEAGKRYLQIGLPLLEGPFFLGSPRDVSRQSLPEEGSSPTAHGRSKLRPTQTQPAAVSCQQDLDRPDSDYQTCTHSLVSGLEAKIWGFGRVNSGTTRWRGSTVTDLIGWVIDARDRSAELGMQFDQEISVSVEKIPERSGSVLLGYVSSVEDYGVLHLNDRELSQNRMKTTAVHELFHHAQARTGPLAEQIIRSVNRSEVDWILESTAVWFEDYVYDDLNIYALSTFPEGGFPAVLGTGLNGGRAGADFMAGDPRNPYYRDLFFYLISKSCQRFREGLFPSLLTTERTDISGLINLKREIQKPEYGCDFGHHLGADRSSSLEAALSFYQYATQRRNMVSLLDEGAEAHDGGFMQASELEFASPSKLALDTASIPPAGALSFIVPSYQHPVAADRTPTFQVIGGNQNLVVSIVGLDDRFVGDNRIDIAEHSWFETSDRASFPYNFSGLRPSFFVTLVNPSATESAQLESVGFSAEPLDGEGELLDIEAPVTGTDVAQRVVKVAGRIPDAYGDQVASVYVRTGGIAVVTEVSDQAFEADAVLSLGRNFIWVYGLDSEGLRVSPVQLIDVRGVETFAAISEKDRLSPSRVVFILLWDQDQTDLDLYSTNQNGATVWWDNVIAGKGILNFDTRTGFGPEVITYRSDGNPLSFASQTFSVDVHYFQGNTPVGYSIDVILNEDSPEGLRRFRYKATSPIPRAAEHGAHGPGGLGSSRYNDILRVECDNSGLCSMHSYDAGRLELAR